MKVFHIVVFSTLLFFISLHFLELAFADQSSTFENAQSVTCTKRLRPKKAKKQYPVDTPSSGENVYIDPTAHLYRPYQIPEETRLVDGIPKCILSYINSFETQLAPVKKHLAETFIRMKLHPRTPLADKEFADYLTFIRGFNFDPIKLEGCEPEGGYFNQMDSNVYALVENKIDSVLEKYCFALSINGGGVWIKYPSDTKLLKYLGEFLSPAMKEYMKISSDDQTGDYFYEGTGLNWDELGEKVAVRGVFITKYPAFTFLDEVKISYGNLLTIFLAGEDSRNDDLFTDSALNADAKSAYERFIRNHAKDMPDKFVMDYYNLLKKMKYKFGPWVIAYFKQRGFNNCAYYEYGCRNFPVGNHETIKEFCQ